MERLIKRVFVTEHLKIDDKKARYSIMSTAQMHVAAGECYGKGMGNGKGHGNGRSDLMLDYYKIDGEKNERVTEI